MFSGTWKSKHIQAHIKKNSFSHSPAVFVRIVNNEGNPVAGHLTPKTQMV